MADREKEKMATKPAPTPGPETEEIERIEFGTLDAPQASDNRALNKMREPFPENQVGLLPQPIAKNDRDAPKYRCVAGHPDADRASVDGIYCGGKHFPSVHLSFVGHAALTARLLDADPEWDWEPMAFTPQGLPQFDQDGGLWIRLTVGGVTRPGYGDAPGKHGATKEIIGDALRNAAMRFGAALNLWHKGDLFDNLSEQGKVDAPTAPSRARTESRVPVQATKAQINEALGYAMDSTMVTSAQIARKHYVRLQRMGLTQEELDILAQKWASLPEIPEDIDTGIPQVVTTADDPDDPDAPMALA
jgi:hypothetical protein